MIKKDSKEFSIGALFSGIVKINQHFIQNYLKNYSGYHHDIRHIGLTYSSFLERLFTHPTEILKVQNYHLEFLQKRQERWKHIFIDRYIGKDKNEIEPFIA